MSDTIVIRIYWVVFIPLWLIITSTLVIPIIWYVISGREWIDPEIIYNKLIYKKDE